MSETFDVRPGDESDAPVLASMFDENIDWMVARGLTAQWGSTHFSVVPERVESTRKWAAGGGMYVCEAGGRAAGCLVLGDAQPYVSPATEPELYVVVLIASRERFARGAGEHLLAFAEDEARERGLGLLRVDCFAGNDGALVRFYEGCGFSNVEQFWVGEWPGQVLSRRMEPSERPRPPMGSGSDLS